MRTNIVIAGVEPQGAEERVLAGMRDLGVLAGGMAPGRIRFVTHLDVDDAGLERAIRAIREVSRGLA